MPQKLSLSTWSLSTLWSRPNQTPNSSWFPLLFSNAVFQSIKHNRVTVYMGRLQSPLHCIISWADVSLPYQTPAVCIIYYFGLGQVFLLSVHGTLSWFSSPFFRTLGLREPEGSSLKMITMCKVEGLLMKFKAREISSQRSDVSLQWRKLCSVKNTSTSLLQVLKLLFNANLEV